MHVFAAFYIREKDCPREYRENKTFANKNGLQFTILHSDRNSKYGSDAHFVYGFISWYLAQQRNMVSPFVACNFQYVFFFYSPLFLARMHFSAEELLLYPRRQRPCLRRYPRWRPCKMLWQMLKSWNFSLSVFFLAFLLCLYIILIKPLTTKAHDRRASGDCGTSVYTVH